ncbi:MAG: septum formation initiator family protein [Solirubrobacteraceae bacterium]
MPSARSARTATSTRHARAARPAPRPLSLELVRSLAGVRWDRLGRISLLVVLAVVSLIGVQRTLSYLSTKAQASHERAIVVQLTRSNARLEAQQRALSQPSTIAADARQLGMVRIGEHPYSVTGLSTGR